jgi:hypothetical protein
MLDHRVSFRSGEHKVRPIDCQRGIFYFIVSRDNAVSDTVVDLIKFDWTFCLDGYEFRSAPDPSDPLNPRIEIAAKSNNFQAYQATKFPTLFQQFVDKPASAEGMRDFAVYFGLLEGADCEILAEVADLSAMLAHRASMRRVLELFDQGDSAGLVIAFHEGGWGKLRMELVFDPNGRYRRLPPTEFSEAHHFQRAAPRLASVLVPTSLIQFMWLQIAMYAQSNATLLRCDRCGSPFIVGTGTGRRGTAKFCSNACKSADYRERHKGVRIDA